MTPVFLSDLNGKRGILNHNSDRVGAVVGSEGSGKSNWGLDAFELWYELTGRVVTKEDIAFVPSNQQAFGEAVMKAKKTQMIMSDEGALMSYSRQGMSASNTTVNKFLMTCREEGFYILVMIPNILDLDSYIRKNRLTFLVCMLPGYRYAYFSRKRLRMLLPKIAMASKNNEHPNPMAMGVLPNFVGRFPEYNGILKEQYNINKKAAMLKIRSEMQQLFSGQPKDQEGLTETQRKHLWLYKQGFNGKSIAAIMDCSTSNVSDIKTAIRKAGIKIDTSELKNASDFEIADARKQLREIDFGI